MRLKHKKQWSYHTTKTGRVVYNRKRHFFDVNFIKRLVDLLPEIEERTDDAGIARHALAINAAYKVFGFTLYARAYPLLYPRKVISIPKGDSFVDYDTYTVIRAVAWEIYQRIFQEASVVIMEQFGIPRGFADIIVKNTWAPIMEIVSGLLGPIFFPPGG